MKLSAVLLGLLQDQYRHETANSLRYVSRSSWARFRGLEATADFFSREADGERKHAEIVRGWVEDRNEAIEPEPFTYNDPSSFSSFANLFATAMIVELDTTERLTTIAQTALAEGDLLAFNQVQELLKEQVEEENLYQTILDRIKSRGEDAGAVHDLDVWIGEEYGD